MKLRSLIQRTAFGFAFCSVLVLPASATSTLYSVLSALTMGEATSTTVGLLSTIEPSASLQHLTFTGDFTDLGFGNQINGTLAGKSLTVTMTGILTGTSGSNITVSFTGNGLWGTQPIQISQGISTYYYTGTDYSSSDFQQLVQVGTGTDWGWARGLEWGGGALLGGIVGAAACAPGGLLAVGGGVIGAIAGGETVASFSDRVWKITTGGPLPPPPDTTALVRPNPSPGDSLNPTGTQEATAYDAETGRLQSQSGNVMVGAEVIGGNVSGNICVIPEPANLLASLTLASSALLLRRRTGSWKRG